MNLSAGFQDNTKGYKTVFVESSILIALHILIYGYHAFTPFHGHSLSKTEEKVTKTLQGRILHYLHSFP